MLNRATKPEASQFPRVSKPRQEIDREALRKDINENYSETLAYLGR